MSEVTRVLALIETGDASAAEELLPLVYDELRKLAAAKLAHEKAGQTLEATALVHEAYIRLIAGKSQPHWNGRGHFFGAAAEAMRRILLNQAREKAAGKRGGDWGRVTLDAITLPGELDPAEFIAFNELFERLTALDPQVGAIARLRIFSGLTIPEVAEILELAPRSVDRHWAFARAWLRTQMSTE